MMKAEDWDDLRSRLSKTEESLEEVTEVLIKLREAYLRLCKEHGIEANACGSYLKSLKY